MDRYKRLMALLLGLVLSLSFLAVFVPMEVAADDPDDGLDLFFSEYIEGSSNNKAVEIYNPSANDINLSAYSVVIYANGSNSPGNIIRLVGILKSKEVYVLGHSSANQSGIKDKADQISSSLGFNGNDAVVLKRGDVIIDCIGQIGYDPGTQWKSNNVSTLDMTLLRKPSVTHGRTDTGTFDPSEEWIGLPVDTFSYLGNREFPKYKVTFFAGARGRFETGDPGQQEQEVSYGQDAVPPSIIPDEGYVFDRWSEKSDKVTAELVVTALYLEIGGGGTELFISEYIEGSGNNKAVEIYNPSANDIKLSAYSVEIYANGAGSPTNTIGLAGTLKSKEVYVLAHSSADQAGIVNKATKTVNNLSFNGNDAVVLKRGDMIIDCIGQISFDPGTQWKSNNVSTLDMTLLRKPSVTHGRTDTGTFDPSEEWIGLPVDTFSYLGNDQVRIVGVNSKTER